MGWWTLLPAAASLAGTLLSRPKEKDYIYDTGYMDKYINNLRGQRLDSQISHMIMQPALRAIGAQAGRGQRRVDYQVARQRPGGGIEAQMRMGINQQALQAIEIAGQRAFRVQYRENRRIGDLIGRVEMEKGRIEAVGKMEFGRARTQWTSQVVSAGLGLAASTGALVAKTRKADIAILDKAKSLDIGIDDDMSLKEFKQLGANRGFENMDMFVNQLARDQGIEQALNVYDPSNIPPPEEIDRAVRAGEITPQYGRELKLKTYELKGKIEQFKAFNVMDTDIITEDYVISQVEEGLDPKKGQELIDIIRAKEEMDKYVQGFAAFKQEQKELQESQPENMELQLDMVQKADIPASQKIVEIGKIVTFNKKLISPFRLRIWDEFFDPDSKPENLWKLTEVKGMDTAEVTWIAGLYMQKKKAKAEKARVVGKEYMKTAEGIAIGQITRNRLLLAQAKHRNKPAVKYVEELLNVKSYEDLANLGRNLAGIQTRIAEIAEYAEIPVSLAAYTDLYGSLSTPADLLTFGALNKEERIKYLKQKWQDDMMDRVYKALKAAEFPGVGEFDTEIGGPAFMGFKTSRVDDVYREEPTWGTKYQESIPDDLSIWE